jgi:hypothetical protein
MKSSNFYDDVRKRLNGEYTTDQGKTWIKGHSLSYLLDDLRERWRFKGHRCTEDYRDTLRAAGFSIVRARSSRFYRNDTVGLSVECDCVTVKPKRII